MAPLILVIAGVTVLAHTAPFPFLLELFHRSRSRWRVKPVPGAPRTIYLTFDDGPNPDWTPALLDALRALDLHATFFLIDKHITPETEAIVKRMADEGHAIALHSGDRWLMLRGPEGMARTVAAAATRIRTITGREPCHVFRPHGGWRSAAMYAGLRKAGYTLVGWSWRMWDWNWWRGANVAPLAARLVRTASPGAIIVIHDGHHVNPRADRRFTIDAVKLVIPGLRARGFGFGLLCDDSVGGFVE